MYKNLTRFILTNSPAARQSLVCFIIIANTCHPNETLKTPFFDISEAHVQLRRENGSAKYVKIRFGTVLTKKDCFAWLATYLVSLQKPTSGVNLMTISNL